MTRSRSEFRSRSAEPPRALERTGPLTFGQLAQLVEYEEVLVGAPEAAWTRTLTQRWALPADTEVSAVRDALALLARRHEIVRTTFERDDSGDPVQKVWKPGAERIRTIDPGALASEAGWTESYLASLRREPLPVGMEPPITFDILAEGDTAKDVLIAFHHIVADYRSMQILHREFLSALTLLSQGKTDLAVAPPRQPIDEALIQAARAGQEGDGLEPWREVLDATAPTSYPRWDERRSAGYTATFASESLQHAVSVLSQRNGLWPAQALLGLYAFVIARYTGLPSTSLCVISSNRFTYPTGVHCCALRVPVVLPTGAVAPDELMKTVEAATRNLHRNADHDARALRRMLDGRQESTGFNTRLRLEYNFFSRRGGAIRTGMPYGTRSLSTFRHEPTEPADPTLTYLAARPGRGTEPMVLSLESNEAFLPLPAASALLRAMESLGAELAAAGDEEKGREEEGTVSWAAHMDLALNARPAVSGLLAFRSGYVDAHRIVRAVNAELGDGCVVDVAVRGRGTPRERLAVRLSESPGHEATADLLAKLRRRAHRDPSLVIPTEVM
ncbi:condensation domain-containing protein [Streptomyces sp. NPDC092046]|uniref:condensation domain-containing protein n=1 Tax=Streptomyces sp. NPDC092046 TaxID=3366009 RepID=UPI003822A0E5